MQVLEIFGKEILRFGTHATPRPALDRRVGGSGTSLIGGLFDEEYNTKLLGAAKYDVYTKMLWSDPQVNWQIKSTVLPIVGATWDVIPGDPDNPRSVEAADFIKANLLGDGDSTFRRPDTWRQTLEESLTMLQFGHSIFVKVFTAAGNKIILQSLRWLHPRTIVEWRFDDDEQFLGIKQQYTKPNGSYKTESIDAADLFILTYQRTGINLEGVSFLRPMYKPYYLKDMMQKYDGIAAMRMAVPVPKGTLGSDPDDADRENMEAILKSMRQLSERSWALIRDDEEIGYIEHTAKPKDLMPSVKQFNDDLATAGGKQFAELGKDGKGGSLALGRDLRSVAMMLVQSIGGQVCERYQLEIVEPLVKMNFTLPPDAMPRLTCSRVAYDEELEAIDRYRGLVKDKVLDSQEGDAAWVRKAIKAPDVEEPEEGDNPLDPMKDPFDDTADDDIGNPLGLAHHVTAESIARDKDRLIDLPSGTKAGDRTEGASPYWREPTDFENAYMNLAALATKHDEVKGRTLSILRQIVNKMITDVALTIRNMETLTQQAVAKLKPRHLSELKTRLRPILEDARTFGREQAGIEIAKQRGQTALATPAAAQAFAEEAIGQMLFLEVDGILGVFRGQVLREVTAAIREGLFPVEAASRLAGTLPDLMEPTMKRMSTRVMTSVFNAGRNETFQAERIAKVIRTEILDFNTCDACHGLDQTVVDVNSADYAATMPPNGCEGGAACRGVYVAIVG